MAWRVSRGGQLDAIAHAVKDEGIWRLICDLMESAVQSGWEGGSGTARPVQPSTRIEDREPELVGAR